MKNMIPAVFLIMSSTVLIVSAQSSECPTNFGNPDKIDKKYDKENRLISETPIVGIHRHGIVKLFYQPENVIRSETAYVKDNRCGWSKTYFKNGTIANEEYYVNEKKHGVSKTYFEDGKLKREEPFLNGALNGIARYYSIAEGKSYMWQTISWVKGKFHGPMIKYHRNGQVASEQRFQEGRILIGTAKKYFENGNLLSENIVTGETSYIGKEYHLNGQLKTMTNYVNGKRHGEYKQFDKNGKLVSSRMFNNGRWVRN